MKRKLLVLWAVLALVFGLALQAQAYTIALAPGTSPLYVDPNPNGNAVFETVAPAYGAKDLISLTLPPGLIVDNPSNGLPPTNVTGVVDLTTPGISSPYYSKIFTFTAKDTPGGGGALFQDIEFTFHIKNSTPYTWTNYEFLLTGTVPTGVKILEPASNTSPFKGEAYNDTALVYYQAGNNPGQIVDPGDTALMNFKLEIPVLTGDQTITVDFNQIATVPIPPSALLLGSGLLGLVGFGWRRKRG